MNTNTIHLALIVVVLFMAAAWASPSESDLETCQASGQSRETCIHSVMP